MYVLISIVIPVLSHAQPTRYGTALPAMRLSAQAAAGGGGRAIPNAQHDFPLLEAVIITLPVLLFCLVLLIVTKCVLRGRIRAVAGGRSQRRP